MEGLKRMLESRKAVAMIISVIASLLVMVAAVVAKKFEIDIGLDKETALTVAGGIVSLAAVYIGAQGYADGKASPPPEG